MEVGQIGVNGITVHVIMLLELGNGTEPDPVQTQYHSALEGNQLFLSRKPNAEFRLVE